MVFLYNMPNVFAALVALMTRCSVHEISTAALASAGSATAVLYLFAGAPELPTQWSPQKAKSAGTTIRFLFIAALMKVAMTPSMFVLRVG